MLSFDASCQEWLDAGYAVLTPKAEGVDLTSIHFKDAQANALVHLSPKGAHALDIESRRHSQGS